MKIAKKTIIKTLFFLAASAVIIFNWNNISWMFSYRVISGLAYDFLNPYEDVLISANNMTINRGIASQIHKDQLELYPYSQNNDSLYIAKIDITAPIVMGKSADAKVLTSDLNRGVVYYPGSVLPSQNGQIVVLGHSAPPNWPKIKYDWVFSRISELNLGDKIVLYKDHRQYTYAVVQKDIVQVGQDIESNRLNGKNNILTLVSCWPPGKNYKRIAIHAELTVPLETIDRNI